MKLDEVVKGVWWDDKSEADQIRVVTRFPGEIAHITNPSEAVQMAAIKSNWGALENIEHPTDNVCKHAINLSPYALIHIKNPSEELQLLAVQQNPAILYNMLVDDEFVGTITNNAINAALTHSDLRSDPEWAYDEYPETVKILFHDNALLYKKWMRYWERNKVKDE